MKRSVLLGAGGVAAAWWLRRGSQAAAPGRNPPATSPLEPIFAGCQEPIPESFRAQFLHSVDDPVPIVLSGVLHHVWHRPEFLGPVFRLLGLARILVPDVGEEIPATLRVITGRKRDGSPYHVWYRTMAFSRVRHFPTTIVYDPETGLVIDEVGPGNATLLAWRAVFTPPLLFTLDTQMCGFRVLGRAVWLPRWLWPWLFGVVHFTQRAAEVMSDQVEIEIVITHPAFGRIFGYDGTFHVERGVAVMS